MHRGWSYEAVLPYFKKSEHYEPGGDDTRGSSGPLNVAIIVAENRPVLVVAACDLRARPAKEIARGVKQLTLVRSPANHIGVHGKGIRASEGIMFRRNLWNKSVPRVELDQRARDARLRLDQIERLAVPPAAEMSG